MQNTSITVKEVLGWVFGSIILSIIGLILFNPLAFIIFGIIGALIGIIVAHGRRMNNITQYLECARCLILLSTAGYIFGGEIGGILSEFTGLAYCLQRRSFKELSRMVNGLAGVALGGNIGIMLNALYSLPLASITPIIFGSIGGWLSLKFSKNIRGFCFNSCFSNSFNYTLLMFYL